MPTADLPPPPPAVERSVLHDSRAIHDCATLRYADFTADSASRWAIVILEPAPDSGSATVPGASLQSGELKAPAGAETVVQKKGRWKRQGAIGRDWPPEGVYAWTEPFDKSVRVVQPEDIYSPFASGGVILFRPTPGAAALAEFGRVHLVFREWSPLVPLVFTYVQQQGLPPGSLPEVEALQRMVTLENPLLSLIAFRELAGQQEVPGPALLAHLNRVRGSLRASFAYVLLYSQAAEIDSGLEAAIERAATSDTLLPLASGALSVLLFRSADTAAVARAKSLILRVRQRAGQLGPPLKGSETLLAITHFAGIAP
jgi:hypothetical protein